MQKTQILKKNKTISEALSSKKAKYIIGTSLLSVVGIALPKVVHLLAGSNAGAMFLPMHIAVLISALTFGILSSTIVAGTSVFLSTVLKIREDGPLSLTAREYIPLIPPIITPFKEPRQEMAINAIRSLPALFPKTVEKA